MGQEPKYRTTKVVICSWSWLDEWIGLVGWNAETVILILDDYIFRCRCVAFNSWRWTGRLYLRCLRFGVSHSIADIRPADRAFDCMYVCITKITKRKKRIAKCCGPSQHPLSIPNQPIRSARKNRKCSLFDCRAQGLAGDQCSASKE
jgi:hypothetical protein